MLAENELKQIITESVNDADMDKIRKILFESSWSSVLQWIENHDTAIMSAFKRVLKDIHETSNTDIPEGMNIGDSFTTETNRERSKDLRRYLLAHHYGVTKLSGSYIEGVLGRDLNEVAEESWFVVNLNDNPNFYSDLCKLAGKYNQDSFIYKPAGEQAYLVGTNDAGFPGYGNKVPCGELTSLPSKLMYRIKNACFVFVNKNKFKKPFDDDESSFQKRKLERIKQNAEKEWEAANNCDEAMYVKLRNKTQKNGLSERETKTYENLCRQKMLKAASPIKEEYVSFVVEMYLRVNRKATIEGKILQECYNDFHSLVNDGGVTLTTINDVKGFARQALGKYTKI